MAATRAASNCRTTFSGKLQGSNARVSDLADKYIKQKGIHVLVPSHRLDGQTPFSARPHPHVQSLLSFVQPWDGFHPPMIQRSRFSSRLRHHGWAHRQRFEVVLSYTRGDRTEEVQWRPINTPCAPRSTQGVGPCIFPPYSHLNNQLHRDVLTWVANHNSQGSRHALSARFCFVRRKTEPPL